MNHAHIEREDIVDRYVTRQLSDEERREFEVHYFECQACQGAVLTAQTLAQALAADRPGRDTEEDPGARWPWLPYSLAAALALALVAGGFYNWRARSQIQQLEHRLELLKGETELLRSRVVAFAGGSKDEEPVQTGQHFSGVVFLELPLMTRGTATGPVTWRLSGEHRLFHVAIPLAEWSAAFDSFDVTLLTGAGSPIMTVRSLKPDEDARLHLTLDSSLLSRGLYRFRIEGVGKGRRQAVAETPVLVE